MMLHPVNGVSYDSFICQQYFDLALDGPAAPDESAVAAINAINAIPKNLTYDDRHLVEAARKAYESIATIQQKALVTNYADLVAAENKILALTPKTEEKAEGFFTAKNIMIIILVVVALLMVSALVFGICFYNNYKEVINKSVKAVRAKRKAAKDVEKAAQKEKKAAEREKAKAEKAAKAEAKKAEKAEKAEAKKAKKDKKNTDAPSDESEDTREIDGGKDETEN